MKVRPARRYPSQRPHAERVAWISGHRPGRQKHVSALNVAVVTGREAPDLQTTKKHCQWDP